MQSCHSLDLRNAAFGQLGRPNNAHASVTKRDNAAMVREVRLPPSIPAFPLGNLDPFALAFTTGLVIVAGGLNRYP